MERKNPITLNEAFTCEKCGAKNPKAAHTCRNHCRECLYSKHVDQNTPGDRQNSCGGLMDPISVTSSSKKGQQIVHECIQCKTRKLNKVANDDNTDLIIKLMQNPYE